MSSGVRAHSSAEDDTFTLESHLARVVVARLGGKIRSLVDTTTGRELLWQDVRRDCLAPVDGARWQQHDMSGWEDCLPTVAASTYPAWPWSGITLPEHGEVWALPWTATMTKDGVTLTVQGMRLPYHFEKSISLKGAHVQVRHRLTNPSAYPLRYLWAAHPLFQVRPGMHIVLPEEGRLYVDWSRDQWLGTYPDAVTWPEARDARGAPVRLDQLGPPSHERAAKLYLAPVTAGWCGIYDSEHAYAVALSFDAARLPALGVWINLGGWPTEEQNIYHIALEPTTGHPDLLDVAVARGTAATIGPGETQTWTVTLCFGPADTVPSLLQRNGLLAHHP